MLFRSISPDSAFNTAVSFVTNTNWQGYGGESSMSYLVQMLALTVQNFFSAATGIAVAFALIRGFARGAGSAGGIGNFWVDLTRITLWVLLPLSFVLALFFAGAGVIQNFDAYRKVALIDPVEYSQPKLDAAGNAVNETLRTTEQIIAMGPVASQESIKMLGTNGGGFFNANSAHPFENPTPLTNFVQMLAIFLIPAGLCFAFGRMVGDARQGWAIFAAMGLIFIVMALAVMQAEQVGNPLLGQLGVNLDGGNLEGKETRFGATASALFAAITTDRKSTRLNSSHIPLSRMPSSA